MPKIIPISISKTATLFKIIIIRMYNTKFPIELIKKKVQDNTITYKFKWNNGTISIEPMSQLTPQLLELVHQYELKQYYETKKKVKLNQTEASSSNEFPPLPSKNVTKIDQISLLKMQETPKTIQEVPSESFQQSNYQSNAVLPQDIMPQTLESNLNQQLLKTFMMHPHLPRQNKECMILSIKRINGEIIFLIKDEYTKWVKLEELKKDSPITLCDYLLPKVRFK
ncbi:unnamed protein product (macronuclear) [Paramecium tetraurelia]|uniref:Chromo domain-containing protein n=1 Tax=Paramecium tetraurelia TaxID=5888 RepID=A0DW18_PARTE|nr:uncharacterized protein GSPATT00020888001 [Paramecium tetraurelia]CAK87235.1 unnamed protein product [Paramecium tetraurelia]|eukprot:XP_001454632.1 hypothetical protein (macronuclear) [Paramecium tetraurelia strain d4-2]